MQRELTLLLLLRMRMALATMTLLMIMRCKKFCGESIEKQGTACEIARGCIALHCCCCCCCCCCALSSSFQTFRLDMRMQPPAHE